jgi:hypothetical protein
LAIFDDVLEDVGQDIIPSRLEVSFADTGILSISRDGVWETLNGGQPLVAGALYAFDVYLWLGVEYNLKYSVGTTAQLYWFWRRES